ncbi:ABC transporter ATP-binding protein [Candidatus Methylocalor cossyra]
MTDLRNPLVVLRQLTHSYREGHLLRPVLLGIDGAIGRGEFVALFGQSGSGKSTLLNLIAGLDLARSGTVMIEGHDLAGLDEHRRTLFRRRHIGFVYQFFHLIPTLTVEENVALPAELNGYSAALTRERCRTLLDEVGLAHRAASFPDTLSGGEQQRVALARALVHDPALILADEPTGNLDRSTGAQVLDLLDRAVRKRGKTLLVATHSPEVAERADRIWRLRDGRLEAP